MAQFALHIAAGIYAGDALKADAPLRCGLLVGSFAPDLDFVPLLALFLFDPRLAMSFHRSASHSLLIPVILLLAAGAAHVVGKINARQLLIGLCAGFLMHTTLDIFFWFAKVNLLWPLDRWGVETTVNLWSGIAVPPWLKSLVQGSGELLCFSLLYWLLGRRAQRYRVAPDLSPVMPWLTRAAMALFLLFALLAFFMTAENFSVALYATTSLTFAPVSLYLLWRLRAAVIAPASGERLGASR